VANANLGADQNKSLTDQLNYTPLASNAGTANDPNYDPTVYGDWYQWGRKKDGHEDRTVPSSGTNKDYLTTNNGVETTKLDANGQIKTDESSLYGKFIQRNDGTFDWRQYPETTENSGTAPADDWTWNKPDNNPCPSGWRLPTQAEWAQIVSNNTWVWRLNEDGTTPPTPGYEIKPGGAGKPTSFFLPAAGLRGPNGGVQNLTGAYGYYWSSTVNGTSSYYLNFSSVNINPAATYDRSIGFSVRCVSESFDPE
jgi:uncharacterized protein (TIGR02145 family)